jgi:hypothetical protein
MPRGKPPQSISEIIAVAVREFLAEQAAAQPVVARAPSSEQAAAPTGAAGSVVEAHPAEAPAATPEAATAVPAPPPPGPPAPSAAAAARRESQELIERVRAELAAAYDGRPVSPSRIAYRLQTDPTVVDATLTYLVTRREAKLKWNKGKAGYVPVRPVPQ